MSRWFIGFLLVSFFVCGCDDSGESAEDAGIDQLSDQQEVEVDQLEDVTPDESTLEDQKEVDETSAEETCYGCHGTAESFAPPPALDGATEPTDLAVGAHMAHLTDSDWRTTVKCKHCHVVPEEITSPGHIDMLPAEVVFTGLATIGDVGTREGESCSVYCHGSSLRLSQNVSPAWNQPGELDCQACHGMPPAAPHPQEEDCGRCHIEVINPDQSFSRPDRHIDSIIQAPLGAHIYHLGGMGGVNMECSDCHNGTNYHGALKDGNFLDETTICAPCHGSSIKEHWHSEGL